VKQLLKCHVGKKFFLEFYVLVHVVVLALAVAAFVVVVVVAIFVAIIVVANINMMKIIFHHFK
jgi:hypothetical protein